jgi:hypothetical protein
MLNELILTLRSLTIKATRHQSFFGIEATVRAPVPFRSWTYPNIFTVILPEREKTNIIKFFNTKE